MTSPEQKRGMLRDLMLSYLDLDTRVRWLADELDNVATRQQQADQLRAVMKVLEVAILDGVDAVADAISPRAQQSTAGQGKGHRGQCLFLSPEPRTYAPPAPNAKSCRQARGRRIGRRFRG